MRMTQSSSAVQAPPASSSAGTSQADAPLLDVPPDDPPEDPPDEPPEELPEDVDEEVDEVSSLPQANAEAPRNVAATKPEATQTRILVSYYISPTR